MHGAGQTTTHWVHSGSWLPALGNRVTASPTAFSLQRVANVVVLDLARDPRLQAQSCVSPWQAISGMKVTLFRPSLQFSKEANAVWLVGKMR